MTNSDLIEFSYKFGIPASSLGVGLGLSFGCRAIGWVRLARLIIGLVLIAALLVAARGIFGEVPVIAPTQFQAEWIVWAGVLTTGVSAVVMQIGRGRVWVAGYLCAGLGCANLFLGLSNAKHSSFGPTPGSIMLSLVSVAAVALPVLSWLVVTGGLQTREDHPSRSFFFPVGLLVVVLATTGVSALGMFYSRTIKLAEYMGSMSVMIFAVIVLMWLIARLWRWHEPGAFTVRLIGSVAITVNSSAWLMAYWYAYAPAWSVFLGIAAPIAGLTMFTVVTWRDTLWRVIPAAALSLFVALAGALVARAQNHHENDMHGDARGAGEHFSDGVVECFSSKQSRRCDRQTRLVLVRACAEIG